MDILLRVIAIFIEVVILGAIIYTLLTGARLTIFDLGLKLNYQKMIAVALIVVGCIAVLFFAAHLTTFYPTL